MTSEIVHLTGYRKSIIYAAQLDNSEERPRSERSALSSIQMNIPNELKDEIFSFIKKKDLRSIYNNDEHHVPLVQKNLQLRKCRRVIGFKEIEIRFISHQGMAFLKQWRNGSDRMLEFIGLNILPLFSRTTNGLAFSTDVIRIIPSIFSTIVHHFILSFTCTKCSTPKPLNNFRVKIWHILSMARIMNLVSFLILVLAWPNALSIETTDVVKELATQFSSLTSSTWDIVNQLKFVSENAMEFVRAAGAVGAIIATAVDTEFGTVTSPLATIEPDYKGITDPLVEIRPDYKESFTDRCRGRVGTAPYDVLIHMKGSLVNACQLPSQQQLERYAAVLELFQKIEQRHHLLLNQNDFLLVKKYKSIKSSILAKAAVAPMQEKLNTILNSANNVDEVWQALNKLNTDFHYADNTCWIQSIADGNEWKREPILHFAQLVFLDLMKMEITSPTISRFYAKSAIGNLPINESKDGYQFVAEKIKEELGQFGAAEYDYTVIVFPNWTDPEAMAIISEANSYFDLIDVNQINVIVVRIEDNETNYELASKAAEWFTPTIETKMKEAIKLWWDHKRHLKLNDLADMLKEWLQFYRNLVLIHNWKFFSSAATITLGVTQSFIRSVRAEQSFRRKIVPSLFDAEIFHVHMLL
ncbi:hypothetical protein niasHS_008276 [Heterodera schachtii]|uniref:F-box domain-containing protein n=1 Tax=Heterodera schachtii TaxID=97005 RepID=A0ABD2IWX1_HETSC